MKYLNHLVKFAHKHIIWMLLFLIIINGTILYRYQKKENNHPLPKPKYHFYFIGQNSVDPFWRQIRQGIERAAKDYNVVVEFNAPRFNNPMEELKYLDIAITSKVDGIITNISNVLASTDLINEAYEEGIPVVTIENDNKISNRNAFVGTNSFLLGQEAAQLMIEATNGKANIAIIVSSDLELDTASQNLKINGFLSGIKSHANMKVMEVYTSRMGTLSAEEITRAIIHNHGDVDAIFTSTSMDTLGAAQVIVDRNKVGSITLVGYGDIEDILRYIRMGIIYGTVMSDPYRMGYESLRALIDIKEKNSASTFIDTGVKVIKKENLDEYENKIDIVE
ncbi:MAG: substrate-binding domain-containing protein [Clostridiaceae bacterium]|nr:substrate-binding domain-containing protein [Clostridiaceae bacterium]